MSAQVEAIRAAVDSIAFGVQFHIDAFFAAVTKQGGRAYRVNRIADATNPSAVPSDHVLAWGEGPTWSCRLVQIGSHAEVQS